MPNLSFYIPNENMRIPLALTHTQLRFDLMPDRGVNGTLGGYLLLAPLVPVLGTLLPAGIPASTIQTVLQSLVDVQDPPSNAMGCTAPNGGIAIGYGFSVVRAVISPSAVSGPQAGMCGST